MPLLDVSSLPVIVISRLQGLITPFIGGCMKRLILSIFSILSLSYCSDDTDCSQLIKSAEGGNTAAVVNFLNSNPKVDVNFQNENGSTALHFAAYKGHIGTVRELIKFGADIEKRDNLGNTPLIHVSTSSNEGAQEVAYLLLLSGANKKATSSMQLTPLNCSKRGSELNKVLRYKNPFKASPIRKLAINEFVKDQGSSNICTTLHMRSLGVKSDKGWNRARKAK